MGSSTVVRHESQEVSSTVSPRVEGSSPIGGKFFAEFFFSNTILADLTEWSIYGKPRMFKGPMQLNHHIRQSHYQSGRFLKTRKHHSCKRSASLEKNNHGYYLISNSFGTNSELLPLLLTLVLKMNGSTGTSTRPQVNKNSMTSLNWFDKTGHVNQELDWTNWWNSKQTNWNFNTTCSYTQVGRYDYCYCKDRFVPCRGDLVQNVIARRIKQPKYW